MTTSTKGAKWVIDPAHSKIGFKVKHLMIANVQGSFKKFDANVSIDNEDVSTLNVSVKIDTASITTEAEDRDTHLKSADFFDSEKYPNITFESTGAKDLGDEMYELKGNLTIKETTKPITLTVEYGGTITDPWGNTKAAFSVTGEVNRKDFGMVWNAALETGGVLVGDKVKLDCDVEFTKVAE
jgi:polyisoprenoid-binding protein YceI